MKEDGETIEKESQMTHDIMRTRSKQTEDQTQNNNNFLKKVDRNTNLSSPNNVSMATNTQDMASSVASSMPASSGGQSQTVRNLSGDDSDADSIDGGRNCQHDVLSENDLVQNEETSPVHSLQSPDPREAKRARLDGILTTMRQGSLAGNESPLGKASFSEIKRQKRKQPLPQQLDSSPFMLPSSKHRQKKKTEPQDDIGTIQEESNDMSKILDHNIDHNRDDDVADVKETCDSMELEDVDKEGISAQFSSENSLGDSTDSMATAEDRLNPLVHTENDPAPLTATPVRFTGCETELPESTTHMHIDTVKSRRDYAIQNDCKPELKISHMSERASELKSEIIQAVKSAVDSALSRVLKKFDNQQRGTEELYTEGLNRQQQERQLIVQSQNQQKYVHQPLKVPQPKQEREALKEAVSNSQTERASDFLMPYQHSLDVLGRLCNSRAVHDKITASDLFLRNESSDLVKPHGSSTLPFPPFYPYSYTHPGLLPPVFPVEPEQTEALPLVVSSSSMPKKRRSKVTDNRLSPRHKPSQLQDTSVTETEDMTPSPHPRFPHSYLTPTLPTSVAITNPSLHPSDLFPFRFHDNMFGSKMTSSPVRDGCTPSTTPVEKVQDMLKQDLLDTSPSDSPVEGMRSIKTYTLTPVHLRKAKLMFFYTRYPSSGMLKVYFPDVAFNKNNTAQLVKWFSNFREFYYIQMEKQARQAVADGVTVRSDLTISRDSDLFRQLNLHYNRNNQIEAPETFRTVAEETLREFFHAIYNKKDLDSSWKKAIYKIIARMDEPLPEFFKSPNWMEQLGNV